MSFQPPHGCNQPIYNMIRSDFHNTGFVDLPSWALPLKYPYWRIRVEGRNKALKRRCYRLIERLKLRLVESGIDIELINAVCRYLVSFKNLAAEHLRYLLANPNPQLRLF